VRFRLVPVVFRRAPVFLRLVALARVEVDRFRACALRR